AVRRKFFSGASYIDLFCGPGRVMIKTTGEFLDAGALAACHEARLGGSPFSKVYLGDLNIDVLTACATRLCARGEHVFAHHGPSEEAVDLVSAKLDPGSLCLAYLDPYNLGSLPFSIIRTLSRFQHMDMLVHVSALDLKMNLGNYLRS